MTDGLPEDPIGGNSDPDDLTTCMVEAAGQVMDELINGLDTTLDNKHKYVIGVAISKALLAGARCGTAYAHARRRQAREQSLDVDLFVTIENLDLPGAEDLWAEHHDG